MITEETFPSDFDNFEDLEEINDGASNNDYNSSENLCKGYSFSSVESSFGARKLPPIPPRAPMKKKRYQSCQDLYNNHHNNYRSKNYGHVESKVKKFIDQNALDDRRKTLTRHKSMPVDSSHMLQLRDDDQLKDEVDINILKNELFKRSHQISDLTQHNSNRVYSLEIEKVQLKRTIDALRMELHHYKEKERETKERSTASSFSDISQHRSLRSVRDIDVQTDNSEISPSNSSTVVLGDDSTYRFGPKPITNIYRDCNEDLKKKRVTINELAHAQRFDNPLIRELSYNMTEEDIQSYNTQNGLSLSSNISSDLLLSTSDTPLCQATDESDVLQIKKKKKLKHRLMKLMSCVTSK